MRSKPGAVRKGDSMQTAKALVEQPTPAPPSAAAGPRVLALDALRGAVMLALCFGSVVDAESLAGYPILGFFAMQFRHVPWAGLRFWEMIQPCFWFVVGATLPFALARRRERGETFGRNLRHASARAFRLALLGQILICLSAGRYRFEPMETLTHVGLCYFCCFLIYQLPFRWQVAAAALLMAANSAIYLLFPGSAGPFSPTDNIGVVIDRAVFGLNHAGGWVMIAFVGSTVHMLIGAWTGSLLMGTKPSSEKLKILAAAMAASFVAALALTPFNPIMQKTCTASYTFYGAGFVLLAAISLYWLFELRGYRRLAFPLTVVGMNSIFIYMLNELFGSWIDKSTGVFTGRFQFFGAPGPIFQACAAVAVMWYACYWLYKRKIFFKV
jgi:predicted acyltransferase